MNLNARHLVEVTITKCGSSNSSLFSVLLSSPFDRFLSSYAWFCLRLPFEFVSSEMRISRSVSNRGIDSAETVCRNRPFCHPGKQSKDVVKRIFCWVSSYFFLRGPGNKSKGM